MPDVILRLVTGALEVKLSDAECALCKGSRGSGCLHRSLVLQT